LGGIDVVAVDRTTLKEFIELPYGLYRNDPHFVPPLRIAVKDLLNRAKHPFYKTAEAEFFLARRDGRPVGRIAAILDHAHNRFHGEQAGFFGFFDCRDVPHYKPLLLPHSRAGRHVYGRAVRHAAQ